MEKQLTDLLEKMECCCSLLKKYLQEGIPGEHPPDPVSPSINPAVIESKCKEQITKSSLQTLLIKLATKGYMAEVMEIFHEFGVESINQIKGQDYATIYMRLACLEEGGESDE